MLHLINRKGIQANFKTQFFKLLLYILPIIFSIDTAAQCVGAVDNGITEFCLSAGSTKTFSNATASGGIINWISSGDGTFDSDTMVRPTYTPGPTDIANGYVFIYLDVYKDDSISPCSVLPVATLHIGTMHALATPSSQTVCSGTAITPIVLNGSLTGTTYSWTRNNTASVSGIAASGTGNIGGTLTNTTTAPVTVTFTVTPRNSSCSGTPITTTVLVNPRPTAAATPTSQTICSGTTITPITLTSNLSGTTFNWTRNNTESVSGLPASGTGNITGALINNTTAPLPVTFTITPIGTNGCQGIPITTSVTVNPRPTSVISGNQVVCGQSSSNISIAFTGRSPWTFTYSNSTTPVTVTANSTNPYTFTVSPTTLPVTYTVTALSDFNCPAQPADMTGSATLTQSSFPITASAGANGNITGNGTTMVNCGANQTYNITANSCYQIADVIIDGVSQGAISTYTFNNVTATHTINATFSPLSYNITASAGANGSITPNGTTLVNCGANQVYSITPNAGYNIQNVVVDGVPQGAISSYNFTNVTAPHTISATFVADIPLSFTITANAGANGTITPSGSVNVISGANQSFIIAANSCYQVADVLIDGVSQGAITSYTFTNVTATHSISAAFSQRTYLITASAGANGSITPNGATSVNCGANQTYNITANAGFTVENLLVDGVSQGAITSYTFTNVTTQHTINATFAASIPSCTPPTLSGVVSNVLCRNGNSGAINLTTTGGTGPFTYAWSGPNGFSATTDDISGLASGIYNITSTATGGCATTASFTVNQPSAILEISSVSAGAIACFGGTTTLTVVASGGTAPFQYRLNGGAFQTGNTFTANAAGSPYTVTVQDANNCTVSAAPITLSQPSAITVFATAGTISCSGGTTNVTVTATGGTPPYSGTGIIAQQNAGPHTYTVTDARGCTRSTTITIAAGTATAPARPSAVTGPLYGLCGGGNFTYIVNQVSGATGYTWTVPSSFTITGQGTNQIQVSVPTNFTGTGTIGVSALNACGASTQYTFAVSAIMSYPASSITGPSTVTSGQANVQYSLPYLAGVIYTWSGPAGAKITSGQGTNVVTVKFGTKAGNISVVLKNACGTSPKINKSVTISASGAALATQEIITTKVFEEPGVSTTSYFRIYPNPVRTNAVVEFNSLATGRKFELVISNSIGKTLFTRSGVTIAGKNTVQLNLGNLVNGIYFVKLITGENIQTRTLFRNNNNLQTW